MGVRNLDEFRDLLNLALGEKKQTNERLDRWLNDGIEELFVMLDIEGRRVCAQTSTVIGQEAYLLPTDLIATLVVTDRTNKKRILKASIENYERLDAAATGRPKLFGRVDRQMFIHPIPDAVYLLHMFYIKAPSTLAIGTDVSELTSAYDRVIHMLGVKNALMDLGQLDKATFFFQSAQNMIRSIPTEEWLEGQTPAMGVQIARSFADMTDVPRGVVLR